VTEKLLQGGAQSFRGRSSLVRLPKAMLFWAALVAAAGCRPSLENVDPELVATAKTGDALAVHDCLEKLIEHGKDSPEDREHAYQAVQGRDDGSAGYAYARAAIAGRLAEQRGMAAGQLVTEAERYARKSREIDAGFRDGAAARMLGTLYVFAPSRLLEHGDSEEGLSILEELVELSPDKPENRLRLAEAYIALNDPEPAVAHLCKAMTRRADLREDEQTLLDRLMAHVGGKGQLDCSSGEPAS